MLILSEKGSAERKKLSEAIAANVKETGKVLEEKDFGKRTFAYPLKKQTSGDYVLMTLEAAPGDAVIMSKKLSVDERVLRHLLVVAQ